jgi:predicted nucleotidyltransferase
MWTMGAGVVRERAFVETTLPERPDYERIIAFLVRARREMMEKESRWAGQSARQVFSGYNAAMSQRDHEEIIRRAAEVLRAEGAAEVYIFGSFATGSPRPGSDLDVAVVGLPEARFFRALSLAWKAIGRPVDLVDLGEDTPFTRTLREFGNLRRVA